MEVTGRLLILFGMTKEPEACGLEPVMVMLFPLVMYDNSAYRKVEEKRRRKSRQAVEFRGMGKRKEKIVFISPDNRRMGRGGGQQFFE